jgi:hypothetical protein
VSLCNFPTFTFSLPSLSFSFSFPGLPSFSLAIPFPPACPLD